MGSSINDVTTLREGGIKDFAAIVPSQCNKKREDEGDGVSKIIKYRVTSFMDDPYVKHRFKGGHCENIRNLTNLLLVVTN